jgi:hypothetical protein
MRTSEVEKDRIEREQRSAQISAECLKTMLEQLDVSKLIEEAQKLIFARPRQKWLNWDDDIRLREAIVERFIAEMYAPRTREQALESLKQ